jgi:uncharacterized protein (TIGR02284 family)
MESEKVVTTLNKLLETTKDGENGFRTCAGAVTNPNLKIVFEDAARRCDAGAAELEAKIRRLGKEPAKIRHRKRYASSRLDQHQVLDHWYG